MAKPPLLVIIRVNCYKPQAICFLRTNHFTAKTASPSFKRLKRHRLSPFGLPLLDRPGGHVEHVHQGRGPLIWVPDTRLGSGF
jgi:hypothetical protein